MDNFHHHRETSASKIQGPFFESLGFWGVLSKKLPFLFNYQQHPLSMQNENRPVLLWFGKFESKQRDA